MKTEKKSIPAGLPRGFRLTGSFEYEGKPISIYMDGKSGQMAFVENGQLINDPNKQDLLIKAFLIANRHE